jgi:uncharacterized protein (TIGR00369 family)
VHGGAIATLVDAVDLDARVATISMTINYLAPGVGDLLGRGTVTRGGRSLSFVEAEVTDSAGHVVCRATATFRTGAPKSQG